MHRRRGSQLYNRGLMVSPSQHCIRPCYSVHQSSRDVYSVQSAWVGSFPSMAPTVCRGGRWMVGTVMSELPSVMHVQTLYRFHLFRSGQSNVARALDPFC